ncbi:hypothetical protein DMENIID0001_107920 [Sergentomyia squamirostris]
MVKKLLYTKEALKNALNAVKNKMSMRKASIHFGIPFSTIQDKISGKSQEDKYEGKNVLSQEEERKFAEWIKKRAQSGFPVTKDELKDAVALFVKLEGRTNRFKKGRPGRVWMKYFLKRNPDVSRRTPQSLTTRRAKVTKAEVYGWFDEVEQYLKEAGLTGLEPRRIFNCDETAFFLCPQVQEVLAEKGVKSVHNVTNGNDRATVTVLFMGSAAGDMVPPMIVLPYERIPAEIRNRVPSDWSIGRSPDSGWMTSDTFYEYITNCFHKWLIKNEIPLPVILFLDGHNSHLTLPLSEWCSANGIEVVRLYPNATHILQPMDVGYFSPIKEIWRNKRYSWSLQNPNTMFAVKDLGPLLEETMMSFDEKAVLQSSFRRSGLFPLNRENIDHTKFVSEVEEEEPSHSAPVDSTNLMQSSELQCGILRGIKNRVPDAILHKFEECGQQDGHVQWEGPSKYADLFFAWRHMANVMQTLQPVVQDVPAENQMNHVHCDYPSSSGIFQELPEESIQISNDSGVIESTLVNDEESVTDVSKQFSCEPFVALQENPPLPCLDLIDLLTSDENIMSTDKVNTTTEVTTDMDTMDTNILIVVPPDNEINAQMKLKSNQNSSSQPLPSSPTEDFFRDVLRYPKLDAKKKKPNKNRLPSAITNERWQNYYKDLAAKKKQNEEDRKKRRELREENRVEKANDKALKAIEREAEKKQRDEKKKAEEEIKMIKREKKKRDKEAREKAKEEERQAKKKKIDENKAGKMKTKEQKKKKFVKEKTIKEEKDVKEEMKVKVKAERDAKDEMEASDQKDAKDKMEARDQKDAKDAMEAKAEMEVSDEKDAEDEKENREEKLVQEKNSGEEKKSLKRKMNTEQGGKKMRI